jgi:DNA replication and repair protein RecF
MVIRKLTLRHFRNVSLASLSFSGRRQFFLGPNGQGKSNLLEAAGCLTALRSFRTADSKVLIMHDQDEAGIACEVECEGRGGERVTIKVRRDGKELWYDEKRVNRLAEHVGRYPTVVFSSQDLQLIRGAPALRRRWLDLTLSAMDPAYLAALQAYSRALSGRNSLLRRSDPAAASQIRAFDRTLAPEGARIVALRGRWVGELAAEAAAAYRRLAGGSESASIEYASPLVGLGEAGILALLESGRERDMKLGTTLAGPHRDELRFSVQGTEARDFASEGQQRSVTLALRLAQAAWFHKRSGIRPVLLADDVLGELDAERRERFWGALDPGSQVMASGTRAPDAALGQWQVFRVAEGVFTPEPLDMGAPD